MNAQFILLTQSVTGAVIEIILLLIGAALIGFLTAWFYQKHFYTPIIKKLEDEKADLNNQITGLKSDIRKLNEKVLGLENSLTEKDKILAEKEKEIASLKKQKQ
jgi:peptidoglycan hydrolase CwlO-like protein